MAAMAGLAAVGDASLNKPPKVEEKANYMDLPCPIPYEEIQREALMSLKPETFEGLRFDFSKGLNQKFSLSHSVFMGPTEIPSQSPETIKIPTAHYEFGANYIDPKLMLIGRVMTDGRLNARVKCDLTDDLSLKANAQLTSEPHMSHGMINFDYKGKDYRTQFQFGNGALFGASYIQSVTPHLSLGGEVFWAGQHRKSGLGYAARYETDKMVATGQVASTGMVALSYVQKISEKVSLATDFMYNYLSKDVTASVGYDYILRQCRLRGKIDSNGCTAAFLEERLNKTLILYSSSILILFLAISFGFPKTNYYYKVQHLKSTLTTHPTFFQSILGFLHQTQKSQQTQKLNSIFKPSHCVLWMAPFLSGGGYSSESWSYVLALSEHVKNPRFKLAIEQHGDLESLEFWEGLPQDMKNLAFELHKTQCKVNETIVICHSEPGAWYPPLFETLPCPPTGYGDFRSVVGRTMFETDRVNPEHVKRCNGMDLVWVPTEFHVSTFVQSGVDPAKVVKIVQPIDVKFFDPLKYEPLDIATIGKCVLGGRNPNLSSKEFVFLSVFKWEYRKGWDVLLKAYLKEFSEADGVALYLLTNTYHSDGDFDNKIVNFVEDSDIEKPVDGWAPIFVIDTHIAQIDLPRIYKAADAFVLSSRGEGWGRPLVEAMAMSLPVIATNWSGPTEYLTEENSYPLQVDRMSQVMEGPFKGHFWAEPSVDKLRALMRRAISNIEEANAKGKKAREDMIRRFSPEIVAGIVADHINKVLDKEM